MENYFAKLNGINVNDHVEKKNGLTYLSWAWAWAEVKKMFPEAEYTVYENANLGGMPYFTDGNTCMVKCGVTVNGIEHVEWLPVMDNRNKSIPLSNVTSFDINKSVQRALTKACARHGLGLYIYSGEDLPEQEVQERNADTANSIRAEILNMTGGDMSRINAYIERAFGEGALFEELELRSLMAMKNAIQKALKK